jgi:putative HD superfamily hydrolase of NAD metabolism
MADLQYLDRAAREHLTEKRYIHSLGVQRQAVFLAGVYGAAADKASIAGLLHDICKKMPEKEQLQYLRDHGVELDALTLQHPKIWHGITASVYIGERLGVQDPEILSAVRYHTTGKANMSPLELAVYLADYTSEERDYPDVGLMRQLVRTHPNSAVRRALGRTIRKMIETSGTIIYDAWEAWNWYAPLAVREEAENPIPCGEEE